MILTILKARLQKGEITLSDLAQSESSLAGANAQLITAETDLINSKTIFEKMFFYTPNKREIIF